MSNWNQLPEHYYIWFDHFWQQAEPGEEKTGQSSSELRGQHLHAEKVREEPEGSAWSRDGDEDPKQIPELLVQKIWHEHLMLDSLLTESGQRVEVVDAGRWNHAAGPDFLKAELKINGHAARGDVEIHTSASGWRDHGHDRDFDYNGVVLHVFLFNDDNQRFDRRHNGEKIERVCLEQQLVTDLESIVATLEVQQPTEEAETPRATGCQQAIALMSDSEVMKFLNLAAEKRMEIKVGRLAGMTGYQREKKDELGVTELEQLFYLATITYLGQGASKPLFYLLGRRLPIEQLREFTRGLSTQQRIDTIEAALLHVSGLQRWDVPPDEKLDAETEHYWQQMQTAWNRMSPYFADRLMTPTKRWNRMVRPVNLPVRQFAGLARLLARWMEEAPDLVQVLLGRIDLSAVSRMESRQVKRLSKKLADMFEVADPDAYWSWRYKLNGKKTASPMKLIGPARARMICFNGLLPFLYLSTRAEATRQLGMKEHLTRNLYRYWPSLPPNHITRHMTERLFGAEADRAANLIKFEPQQQALIQLFHDCCDRDDPHGNTCRTFT
jgi:hypothetical protein